MIHPPLSPSAAAAAAAAAATAGAHLRIFRQVVHLVDAQVLQKVHPLQLYPINRYYNCNDSNSERKSGSKATVAVFVEEQWQQDDSNAMEA
jgi:hypothetical protein